MSGLQGQVHRLDDAGVDAVDLRRHVRGLHELDVVLDVPGPTPAVEVRHERGSSSRAVHHVVAADHEIHPGVAPSQLEARRRPGERLAHEAPVEAHRVTVDLQARAAQQRQRGLVGHAVADLFQDTQRVCVDGFHALGGDEFEPRPIVGPHVHGAIPSPDAAVPPPRDFPADMPRLPCPARAEARPLARDPGEEPTIPRIESRRDLENVSRNGRGGSFPTAAGIRQRPRHGRGAETPLAIEVHRAKQ